MAGTRYSFADVHAAERIPIQAIEAAVEAGHSKVFTLAGAKVRSMPSVSRISGVANARSEALAGRTGQRSSGISPRRMTTVGLVGETIRRRAAISRRRYQGGGADGSIRITERFGVRDGK